MTASGVRPTIGARVLRDEEGDVYPMVGVYATGHRFGVGRRAVRRVDVHLALGPWEVTAGVTGLPARAFGVPSWVTVSRLDEFERDARELKPGWELFRWPVKGHPDEGRAIGVDWRTTRLRGRVLWHRPKPVRRSAP